jgi:SAM-dependent methyltransferase
MTTTIKRSPFHGLKQIVTFNWPMYAMGGVSLISLAMVLLWIPLPRVLVIALLILAAPAVAWMLMSLIVSHWVYDRSRLCRWDWIAELAPQHLKDVVNIHSGFDESSDELAELFPNANLRVLDIFDEQEMTEPSIARARSRTPSRTPSERVDFRHLGLEAGSADLITLLLAAHEIRDPESRAAFFRELRRILARDGRIILAEHLRDLPNFLAFGPGFMHFHSRRTWIRAIHSADLVIERELSITPFVRIFILRSKT